ncbi:MAG: LruC domain-containing protein [Planctomycetota bacterium]
MNARHFFPFLLAALATPAPLAAQDGTATVPTEVFDLINATVPERDNSGSAYISSDFTPNMEVIGDTEIRVTFLWEGAGYRNTLGYFTYSESGGEYTILSSNLIIPNASFPGAGTAVSGDFYDLRDENGAVRTFTAGEKVGFFVVADGWSTEPLVQSWDPTAVAIPTTDPTENRKFGRGTYTTIPSINPEVSLGAPGLSDHVVMVDVAGISGFLSDEDFYFIGFEDLNRRWWSDDDFNDLVFVVQASVAANVTVDVATVAGINSDTDSDGVLDGDDAYPNDVERAFVKRVPAAGTYTLTFEDRYPELGDADYNDVVVAYSFELVQDAAGDVHDIVGTFELMGRGAGFDHRFGLHLPGLPAATTGNYQVERFLSDDAETVENVGPVTINDLINVEQRRIELFSSTRNALPVTTGDFATNTDEPEVERLAAVARMLISFDSPVDSDLIGQPPYDPFIQSFVGPDEIDVHLPGFDGFSDRPSSLPEETGPTAFLDENGYPWAMNITTSWRWPLESKPIWLAYPKFNSWVSSGGVNFADWYDLPTTAQLLSLALEQYLEPQTFTLNRPTP